MREINVTIAGTTPLLCNRFTDASQLSATSGAKTSLIGEKGSPHVQAEQKLYIGNDGNPMIPQPNMFRCLIDAGKYFKSGKSKVTTMKSSLIPACLEIEGVELPILHKEPWEVDTRPVRIPATGGRILCYRPKFNDWSLCFTMHLDDDVMTCELLREILDAAGKRIGLGDFRPDCKGPFGKFVVTHWERKAN